MFGRALLAFELVRTVGEELTCGNVEGECNILAGLETDQRDCLDDVFECGAVIWQFRGKTALVAEAGRETLLGENRLECVINLDSPTKTFAEGRGAEWNGHELLDVDTGVGVGAAVDDVEERHGKRVSVRPTDVTEEREVSRVGSSFRDREAHAENGVSTKLLLVVGAVNLDHGGVDDALLAGVETNDGRLDVLDDIGDSLLNTLAEVTLLVAISKFVGLECSGRRSRRHSRAGSGVVVEQNLNLDGWVSARVENLSGVEGNDVSHEYS